MRTFTEVSDDRLLAAIPGTKLLEFVQEVAQTQQTNIDMQSIYASRKKNFAARTL
ncbi:MAG TPA: hypothetical protein VHT21_05285 [Stellaceae bacterium]|jgi:uncharacterized protein (DUF169 family)|nr:hypothetical protein [Stellaceae bacterium]